MVEKNKKAALKLRNKEYLEQSGAIENWRQSRLKVVNNSEKEQQRIDRFKKSYYNTINDAEWQETVWKTAKEKIGEGAKKQRALNKDARLRTCPYCSQKIDCANLQRHIDKHDRLTNDSKS